MLEILEFQHLDAGQLFLSGGNMYRKTDDRSAQLIRFASGDEPESERVDTFPSNIKVELIPVDLAGDDAK